jgi:DNA-binding SARP family transcriptional activator/TolB-like protein
VVEFRILGSVSLVEADGRELRAVLAQPKRVALLAYLAAATPRGFHRRDSLVALFWPELDQEHARAALRQALYGLRRPLGEDALGSRGDEEIGVEVSRFWCDAIAFDAAVADGRHADALELYRGDLLEGFFISGAPEFEHWLDSRRDGLRRSACKSAWILADSSHVAGESALAAHWARRAATLARDDEEAVRRLIALLGTLGDRAGAIQTYESFARRLAEEYDGVPATQTRALIAAVRAHETTLTIEPWQPPPPPEAARRAADADMAPPIDHPMNDVAFAQPLWQRPVMAAGMLAVAFVALVVLSAALARGRVSSAGRPDEGTLLPARIVVAPFSNRTGDSTLEHVAQLTGEEITRGLELTDVVAVADPGAMPRSHSESRVYESVGAHALAVATGSGLAVWGSVDRRGSQLELTAQIVDERRGNILRTLEPVPVNPMDPHPAVMTLRDHIMAVVSEAMDPRLGASASPGGNPPRYAAYLAFTTGVGIFYDNRDGRDALPHFRRAAALDSTFALPLIWAAWVHQTLGQCDSTEAFAGRLARLRLSRLEQMQIDRQVSRCRGDLSGAYRLAHALVDARPESELWKEQLARDALNFNRPREAVAILEQLHPDRGALRRRAAYYNWLTNAFHLLGEHERELGAARRARRSFPTNLAALRMELLALSGLGRGREVRDRFDEIDTQSPDPIRKTATVMREVALDLAAHGDEAAARSAIDRTLAWHARRTSAEQATDYLRFERAQSYYAAGHVDSALGIVSALARAHPRTDDYVGLLGALAAQRGDTAVATRMNRLAITLDRPHARGRATFWRACIAAQLGQREEAVVLLGRARQQGHVFNGLLFMSAHVEPSFAALRDYPPFVAFLRPTG